MYDSLNEPGSREEAVYTVWIVFKAQVPPQLMYAMERVIGEAVRLMPTVARVTVTANESENGREVATPPRREPDPASKARAGDGN